MSDINQDPLKMYANRRAKVLRSGGNYGLICTLVCFAWVALSATHVSFSMLIINARAEFDLAATHLGLVMAVGNIAFIVFGIPAGLLADRVANNWLLTASLWLAALGNGLRYFSSDVTLLVAGSVVEGMAFGLLSVLLVKSVTPLSMLARGVVISSTICIAPMITGLLTMLYGLLLGREVHWKAPVAALTGLFVLLALIALAAGKWDQNITDDDEGNADRSIVSRRTPSTETLLLLISAHAFLAVVVAGATTFGVSLLLRKYGATISSVSVSMAMAAFWVPGILGIFGGVAAGWHCAKQNWRTIPLLMGIAAVIVVLSVLLGTAAPISLASLGFQLARVALLFSLAVLLTVIVCAGNRSQLGLLAGVAFVGAYFAQLLGPLVVGKLSDLSAVKGSGEEFQSALWYSLLLVGWAIVHLVLARRALVDADKTSEGLY